MTSPTPPRPARPRRDPLALAALVLALLALVFPVTGLAGDYNGNGTVDAADYVLWRKTPSAYGGDPAGYNTWRNNFGAPGSGTGSFNIEVPEPTSLVLLMLTAAGLPRRARVGTKEHAIIK